MKKPLFIILMVFILLFGFITLRFGSALRQEGNPIPILTSIIKLELTNSDYQQFSETNNGYRYVSKTTRNSSSGYDSIKEFMKEKGWRFKEQAGAGFVFEGDEETVVIETRLYSKHYFLWYVPKKVLN
ncbi:hypothetical protein [Natronincola ferrireducens]|uniref:Uncharacterized protein n=1 Tax=Natronincola ferrireducens TaxID=393762 RepID=A0A1G8Z8V6_9FIRM|nr:hypothetical protein [Natronincola ferrireducens]SDK11447.1 hypothetical protein SAMN05660472_00773 [Natronincola ferrireducens]